MIFSSQILLALCGEPQPYKKWLNIESRCRRNRRVPRSALRTWKFSSFRYLYLSGNNQALINATGHDHASFSRLLELFRDPFYFNTFDKGTGFIRPKELDVLGNPCGRPRDLNPIGCLGLVLMWCRTRGATSRTLNIMFG